MLLTPFKRFAWNTCDQRNFPPFRLIPLNAHLPSERLKPCSFVSTQFLFFQSKLREIGLLEYGGGSKKENQAVRTDPPGNTTGK
jgi:hypothetical protein